MRIEVKENSELVLAARVGDKTKQRIVMYKLTPLSETFGDICNADNEDYYIAVPKGKRIILENLPEGNYELGIVN
ncbi:MAG: hypothetical protein IKF90_11825 [Parasporobacterium sp.]|nr:hypothetical protein [Parasporobacterium sp.]